MEQRNQGSVACVGGSTEVAGSISNACSEGVGAVGGEVGEGVKDQFLALTVASPRKALPE